MKLWSDWQRTESRLHGYRHDEQLPPFQQPQLFRQAAGKRTCGTPPLRPTGLTVAVMTRTEASRHSTRVREPAVTQGTHTSWMELVRSQHT